ncbi:SLATT domain-containing protein [Streptomyces sp. SCA2-2]|uniref:SLATT domain-containing protein n=1 Tax=Streptomyces sp. SCA2-2 TaxID=1563677 RepID=UPI0013EEFC11|nr:SLATT domain-containing protein [Streptomyces sp. SCA2-2]
MSLTEAQIDAAKGQLESIHQSCLYSAQAYFEAAKRAELWGRLMVFVPACVSAVSGFMSSFGHRPLWGGVAAVAGAVAATASFLGATKKSTDFLASARSYTVLRHKVKLELQFLSHQGDYADLRRRVEELNNEYTQIVSSDIPVPNRSFDLASRRIDEGAAS